MAEYQRSTRARFSPDTVHLQVSRTSARSGSSVINGFADAVDRMLELAVVPSFTRIGYRVRSRLDYWTRLDQYDLTDRVVVITGATSGLGLAATRAFLVAGATVEILGRDAAKTAAVCGDCAPMMRGASRVSGRRHRESRCGPRRVRRVGRPARGDPRADPQCRCPRQGVRSLAAGHRTHRGRPGGRAVRDDRSAAAAAAFQARVARAGVSWGGMYTQPLSVTALADGPDGSRGAVAYARAKRAQVTLARMWAEQLRPDRITVHAMHPGWADTPGVSRSLPTLRTAAAQPGTGCRHARVARRRRRCTGGHDGPVLAGPPSAANRPAVVDAAI